MSDKDSGDWKWAEPEGRPLTRERAAGGAPLPDTPWGLGWGNNRPRDQADILDTEACAREARCSRLLVDSACYWGCDGLDIHSNLCPDWNYMGCACLSSAGMRRMKHLRRTLSLNIARYHHVETRTFPWCGQTEARVKIELEALLFARISLRMAIWEAGGGNPPR